MRCLFQAMRLQAPTEAEMPKITGFKFIGWYLDPNGGEYDVEIIGEPVVKDSLGNIVTDLFDITLVTGKLVISPLEITLTSGSATKAYDGEALTNEEVTAEPGWGIGDVVTYNVTGTQTARAFAIIVAAAAALALIIKGKMKKEEEV